MSLHRNVDFETVFSSFQTAKHTPLHSTAPLMQNEVRNNVTGGQVTNLNTSGFAFGMLADVAADTLLPVEHLPFPFAEPAAHNRQFCRFIHPAYLLPYLLFARCAYEVMNSVAAPAEGLMNASYRIPVPLLMPCSNQYSWYVLKAQTVAVDERNRITVHANLYEYDGDCLMLANGDIEHRFMEASLLLHNQVYMPYQNCLRLKVKQHLAGLFEKQYKQWKMIQLLKLDTERTNGSLAAALRLTEETIKSYNKDILHKLKANLGYGFTSIREAVQALTNRGYL